MKQDVYKKVTSKIIADLEKGELSWLKPWSSGNMDGRIIKPLRHNAQPYSGINILMLWGAAMEGGYVSPCWMTFKQAQEYGAHVRKGERGNLVVYANTITKLEEGENGQDEERKIPFMKGYTVFNAEQIDGLPEHYYAKPPQIIDPALRIDHAETFFAARRIRGKPRMDDRRVLNGMLWRLGTGAPRADIPARYGPHPTCANRFDRWRRAGHCGRFIKAVSEAYEGDFQMRDRFWIRVRQHGANGLKRGRSDCMGRSRGGLTTRIHALADAVGRPILLKLTEGQAHDGRSAADMFDTVLAGQTLLADRAHDSGRLHEVLAERGARGNIRLVPGRVKSFPFDAKLYELRNQAERFFNKLNHFRAVASRYDKRDDTPLTSVQRPSLRIWWRTYESVT